MKTKVIIATIITLGITTYTVGVNLKPVSLKVTPVITQSTLTVEPVVTQAALTVTPIATGTTFSPQQTAPIRLQGN